MTNGQPKTRLILIRHGEVEERYHRVFGGRIDMNLSERGHQQAAHLREHLGPDGVDAIYVSPMKRAQQTLAPVAAHSRKTPVTMPDLREVDFGDWTGLKWDEVHARFQVSAFDWLAQIEQGAIQNGECARRLRDRIEPCLRSVLEQHPGQTAAVICHGGVIRMMLSILIDVPLSKTAAFEIDYASVTEAIVAGPRAEIQLLNFAPWRGRA